jgi:hypothetical protein
MLIFSQNAGNGISETPDLKIFRGGMPPNPPRSTPAYGRRQARHRRAISLKLQEKTKSHSFSCHKVGRSGLGPEWPYWLSPYTVAVPSVLTH